VPLLTAFAAAGLLARAAAALAAAPAGVAGDVHVTGDSVTYDGATGRVLLEGNAVVRRGAVVLRARSISWDPATDEVRASGGVLLTDPTRVISADAVRAVLGGEIEAEGVLAFVKDQPVDLSGLRTVDEARRSGGNRLTFSGERLSGTADGPLRLSRARLTLCDCPGGRPPSWEVTAREADIIPGKRAILHWSVLRITPRFFFVDRPVPVLALPWLYLPLGERQSGLLLPVVGNSGASGFGVAQPLYLTLGRSADATLTPEYAFGRARGDVAKGEPSLRGPGARLELRWAPAETAAGQAELGWLHDLDAEPGGEAGDRWALTARHAHRLGERTALAATLRLAGDPVWVRDTTPDVLARTVPYRRSDLLLSHRRDAVVGEVFASYDQPLRPYGTGAPAGTVIPVGTFPTGPYGPLGADVGVASRWGSAAAALVPIPVGPLRLSARAGAARFGPATGGLDVVGRPAATRADARAEIEAPILLGSALTVSPFVRGAALGYAFDDASDPAGSAWGVVGATVASEVSRRFGRLRHAIAPRLEWRAGTRAQGDVLPFPAYDAFDRSTAGLLPAATGSFQQLRAAVETRLEADGAEFLRAEVGQDMDLRAGRLAETFAALAGAAGPVRADARASFFADGRGGPTPAPRIPSWLDRLSELRASVSVHDRRGDSVRAGFFTLAPGGSGRLVVGIDPLFDVRPAALGAAAGASAGLSAALGTAKLSYDAVFFGRATYPQPCPGEGEQRFGALELQQQTGSLSWESSCHCFRIAVNAGMDYCGVRSYRASIDLTGLARSLAR
jgi:LPS-assembly protein